MNIYEDIKRMTAAPQYRINLSWGFLEDHFKRWEEYYNLEYDPDFQRGHVWTEEQQKKYVEYCLRGGYYGRDLMFNSFRFTSGERHPMVLVDGLQRLTAIRKFIKNELRVFNSFTLEELDKPEVILLKEDFIINVHSLPGKQAVYKWYLELNQEGTPHTHEELLRVEKLMVAAPTFYVYRTVKGTYRGCGYKLPETYKELVGQADHVEVIL